jgi:competence protein ComEA
MSASKKLLQFFYGFNKQQRTGLVVLSCLIILLSSWRAYLKTRIASKVDVSYMAQINFESSKISTIHAKDIKGELAAFNPNTVTFDKLVNMGIPERVCKTFIKYRNSGAKFRTKKDVKKIYGISDELYLQLEPYIICEQTYLNEKKFEKTNDKYASFSSRYKQKEKIELNTADSSKLVELPAIGPSFARRIIKYRSLLGGYYLVTQLHEVYGFTDTMYKVVSPLVSVNNSDIQTLAINTCDFKTLCRHPYIGYELCKTIFDWRKKTVITATNLKDIISNDEIYNKLLPYLKFD